MKRVPVACKGCGEPTQRAGRCEKCEAEYQYWRNRLPGRAKYRDPIYLAQPKEGICWICGQPGADTRDHIDRASPLSRPAHRSCNSSRGKPVAN